MPDTALNQDAPNALSRSQARHSVLLTALFNSTLRVYQINNIKAPDVSLTSFLETNSLSNGRSFDASTLPRIDEHVNANAPPIEFYQDPYEFNKLPDGPVKKQSELSRGGEHATSGQGRLDEETEFVHGLPPNKERTEWLADGSSGVCVSAQEVSATGDPNKAQAQRLEASIDKVDSGTNGSSRQEPSPCPSDGLLLSSDDVGSMAPSEQISTDARKTPLSSKEAQKDRLDHIDREKLDGEGHGILSNYNSQQNVSTLGDPTPGEGVGSSPGTERTRPGDDTSRPDGVPKSQIDLARAEAFSGAPTTPDEQLRLEEARSMELAPTPNATNDGEVSGGKESHSMQAPGKSSSHFTHGNTEDGVASDMPHLADLNNQMSGSQSDDTQGAPSEPNGHLARTTPGLRDHMFHGMNGESSRDLTLSRRPPMRIDTGVPSMPGSTVISGNRPTTTSTATANTPSGSATPIKSAHAVASAQSPPERMTTRVSSGALRHKSVSEILGETPKATPIHSERGTFDRGLGDSHRDDIGSLQTPKLVSSFTSPDPATFKQRLSEIKEKERSKLSTVVFTGPRNSENAQTQRSDDSDAPVEDKDYFLTLFTQKAFQPQGAPLLSNLVKTAHKTLTTSDYYTDLNERQACQILTKIHDLQSNQRWSLRQHERSAEPNRPVSHWDVLLGQMKWMRTDFREERKWKTAAARFTADACADWVASSPEDRKSLQVNVRPTHTRAKSRSFSASTPDLVHSADDEASEATDDDSLRAKDSPASAPAAIFSLPPEMFIFGLNESPVAEKLLLELPLYEPNVEVQNTALGITEIVPDDAWKKPLVPVSKFVQGKIVSLQAEEPPRKRSRFNYSEDKSSRFTFRKIADLPKHLENAVRPEQEDVALFDPENKHIRDRIHAGHAFRPPSEYIMPTQSFFESRQSSQWTQDEDHELRKLVRDYAYNWSLISSCLSPPSLFHSGAERRTPWECFERWISLEGLPVEMAKINYFRAYHSRLQAAQRTVEVQQQALQQAQGNNAAQIPMRRRTTLPFSVERRKNAKHIHLIDAMRKLAKKRETAVHKQQHVASLAAMRKANEAVKQRPVMHTPQEFSRLKHERQVRMEEQQKQYRAQMLQQQKAAQAAKVNQQVGQQSNGIQPVRNPIPGIPNGSSPNMAAANVHGQIRGGQGDIIRPGQVPRGMNGQPNGILPTNSHGVPHAPMQPNLQAQMQMQQRLPPSMVTDPRMAHEVARVQAEQVYRQQQRQHQAQSNGQAGSPPLPNPNLLSQSNPNMLASLQGRSSPSINGVAPINASSTSPRMTQPQTLSSGMTPAVNQIQAQFKARHPQASPDQISRMTTDTLLKMSNEARQHAMQAAAGNANANAMANNSAMGLQTSSPMQQAAMMTNGNNAMSNMSNAQYAQYMRSQQASPQRGASVGGGQNGSRSVTPLMSGSAQGGPRPSQSPSARQVGLAGGQ